MTGSAGLLIELFVGSHMESGKVDGSSYYGSVGCAGLDKTSCGTGNHSAACLSADYHLRILSIELTAVHSDFISQSLNACDTER